jgi:hypothetical protein
MKELKDKIKFYLDAREFLNKPKRIFMGLEFQTELLLQKKEINKKQHDLIKKIIKQLEKDYYKHTLPQCEDEIKATQ